MQKTGNNAPVFRTGEFELDLKKQELRRNGQPVALEDQPLQLLELFVRRAGKVVTRAEILEKLWATGSAVDPDRSLDLAIQRLRAALGDPADKAGYIEALPGRGYRFIARVAEQAAVRPAAQPGRTARTGGRLRALPWILTAALGVLLVVFALKVGPPALRWLRPAGKAKLAVLPFKNLSGRAEDESLADGMTEEMITRLGRVSPERLGVIAATSVWALKHAEQSIQQIGEKLNVDYAVEGSVSHERDRVRISAKLIQVREETQIWGESYDRPYADLLAIESEVAAKVTGSLALKLLPEERTGLASPEAVNIAAHESYVSGRSEWRKRTPSGLLKSVDYYNRAIAADANYAAAYAGLADTYDVLGFYGILPPGEAYGKARTAAQKALQLDGASPEAHAALAEVLLHYDYDWRGAEEEYRRAISPNGNNATAHEEYSLLLALSGREADGLKEIQRAHDLDPLSAVTGADWALHYFYARKYPQAIQKAQEALDLEVNFPLTHSWMGRSYLAAGMPEKAIMELRQAAQLAPQIPMFQALLGHAYGVTGQRDAALQILAQLQSPPAQPYVSPVLISLIYVGLDDRKQAMDWAEKAYAERAPLLTRVKRDPILDGLRGEPRFVDLVRRVGPPN